MFSKFTTRLLVLSALFMVSAAYSARGPEFANVVGGAEVAGCKGDCSAGSSTLDECLDAIQGQACDTNYCTRNIFRWVKCEVGDPGSDEDPCDVDYDNTDWGREMTVRREACTNGNYGVVIYVPGQTECVFDLNGNVGASSPCITTTCATGPIQTILSYSPRPVCK